MFYEQYSKTQSTVEYIFLADCVTVGLKIETQYAIGPIHADFAIPERKLVIELDSKAWHSSPEAIENDRQRDLIYKSNGWNVLRIQARDVFRYGEDLAGEIRSGKHNSGGVIINFKSPLYLAEDDYDE